MIKKLIMYVMGNKSAILVSLVLNIFSEKLVGIIKDKKAKRDTRKIRKQLKKWVIKFQDNHIDSIIAKEKTRRLKCY